MRFNWKCETDLHVRDFWRQRIFWSYSLKKIIMACRVFFFITGGCPIRVCVRGKREKGRGREEGREKEKGCSLTSIMVQNAERVNWPR